MSSEKIKMIYQQSNTNQGGDFITPIVFILVVLSLFGYLYTNIQRKLMHMSWSEQKCNPRYLFFSGFLDPFNKNPWTTTQDNFQRCVSSNIYKDPSLTRVIQKNKSKILKHKNEMKQNLATSNKYVSAVNKGWEETNEKAQDDLIDANTVNDSIFQKHQAGYQQILLKTSQMFHLINSIVLYIKGILLYRLSNYKTGLDINANHEYFMSEYHTIYDIYSNAYQQLSSSKPHEAINSARDAIERYNKLNKELEDFMNNHYNDIQSITEGCYQLKYNMEDDLSCSLLFPNLNKNFVDFYPTLKHAINT